MYAADRRQHYLKQRKAGNKPIIREWFCKSKQGNALQPQRENEGAVLTEINNTGMGVRDSIICLNKTENKNMHASACVYLGYLWRWDHFCPSKILKAGLVSWAAKGRNARPQRYWCCRYKPSLDPKPLVPPRTPNIKKANTQ